MEDVLLVLATFFGIASLFAIPLAVGLGLPLAAWLTRTWLLLKERELEVKKLEVTSRDPFYHPSHDSP